MTDEKEILRAQVFALSEQFGHVEATVKQLNTDPPELHEAMAKRFVNIFKERRAALDNLLKRVARGGDLMEIWETFGRERESCDALFRECLGYIGGVLLRKERLDRGINEVADALLRHVSAEADDKWERLTVLAAEGNFFTTSTEIIRLPFPDFTIWNLPVAVHELGHYRSTHDKLFTAKVEAARLKETQADARGGVKAAGALQKESYLHEFFADLFAIYTLGPAYAACCFVTRFSPSGKNFCEDGDTHPSDAKRGHLLLLALEEMNKESDPPFTGAIAALKGLWLRNLQATVKPGCTDVSYLKDLRFHLLRELFYSILGTSMSSAKYPKAGWARARALLDEFASGADAAQLVRDDDTIVDVLNGAWAWRLSRPSEDAAAVASVNLKALEMCRIIARR